LGLRVREVKEWVSGGAGEWRRGCGGLGRRILLLEGFQGRGRGKAEGHM
jgi:hypothetical protein